MTWLTSCSAVLAEQNVTECSQESQNKITEVYVAALKSLSLDNFWFPADRMGFFSLKGEKKKKIS